MLLIRPIAAPAQGLPARTAPDPLLTLASWADDVWLDVLDREGTRHGRLAEQGILQRFDPEMDHEYALDVATGMFGLAGDAGWAGRPAGIRVAGASVSHPHILNRLDWRDAYPVASGLDLTADYTRDHSLTDQRDYARVGLRWRPGRSAETGGWTFGGRVGLHFFKPEADVELAVSRVWRDDGPAAVRLDLGIAALDAFNDVVFVGLGVDPDEVEAHVDHEGLPLATRVRLEGRGRRWRGELHAGATTERRASVTFPGPGVDPVTGAEAFTLEERVAWVGGLLEGGPFPEVSMAGHARVVQAHTARWIDAAGPPALRIRERTAALGAVVRWTVRDGVHASGAVETVWRPEDRRAGGMDTEHDDRAVFASVGLARRRLHGWTGRVAWTTLDRRAGSLLPQVGGRNQRLVTEGGYHTLAGFRIVAGLRWDLDGSPVFDGAHLRLTATGS